MDKKYKLLKNDTITIKNRTLYRIQALRNLFDVKKGELGGYIEKESNLSHEGRCWVFDNAKVYEDAWIYGNALIYGNARIYGYAKVYEDAQVFENAEVYGNSKISDQTWVYGDSTVKDVELSDLKDYEDYQWYYDTPLYKAMYENNSKR